MIRNKHLRIVIAADGTCAVDAINFSDPSCQAATSEITTALRGRIDHEHLKPEAHVRERCRQPDREQAR